MRKNEDFRKLLYFAAWSGAFFMIVWALISCTFSSLPLRTTTPLTNTVGSPSLDEETSIPISNEALTPRPETSVVIQGRVTYHANSMPHGRIPLARVNIYLASDQNPNQLIAVTNEDGEYISESIVLHENEIVHIRPEAEGWYFYPNEFIWGNNYDLASRTYSFTASSTSAIYTPTPPPDGIRIRGAILSPTGQLHYRGDYYGKVDLLVYLAIDSKPGKEVAVVDGSGFYESGDILLEGRHTIRVWVALEGDTQRIYMPTEYSWIHEGGYEDINLIFREQP
jgi:hypothetical protein